ncbi:MAG TPA: alpha/beta hydrolase [Bacteroidota bacterium]|nr:alpha/beta hydrolase [Bacteroidota bacterium]
MTDEYLTVDGMRTHIRRAGSGKILLLIHGLGAPQMWQRVIEPLSATFDVIAVDLPGFGESDPPSAFYSPGDYSDFIDHLLTALMVRSPHIVGVSFGGQVAAGFASRNPGNIGSLVLVASTGLLRSRWFARYEILWAAVAAILKRTVLKSEVLIAYLSRRSYYDIRNRPEHFVANFMGQFSDADKADTWLNALRHVLIHDPVFEQQLNNIRCRTLIIWGAQDQSVPASLAHRFQKLIPGSDLNIFPECSHSVPLEKPSELCDAVTRFVHD